MSQRPIYASRKVFANALRHSQDGSLWDLLSRRGAVIILVPGRTDAENEQSQASSRSNVVPMKRPNMKRL